jgi:hypothetical protein
VNGVRFLVNYECWAEEFKIGVSIRGPWRCISSALVGGFPESKNRPAPSRRIGAEGAAEPRNAGKRETVSARSQLEIAAIARATVLSRPTISRFLGEECNASSRFSDGQRVGRMVCGTGQV